MCNSPIQNRSWWHSRAAALRRGSIISRVLGSTSRRDGTWLGSHSDVLCGCPLQGVEADRRPLHQLCLIVYGAEICRDTGPTTLCGLCAIDHGSEQAEDFSSELGFNGLVFSLAGAILNSDRYNDRNIIRFSAFPALAQC